MRIICNKCNGIICIMINRQIESIKIFTCPKCGNDLRKEAEVGIKMGLIWPRNK